MGETRLPRICRLLLVTVVLILEGAQGVEYPKTQGYPGDGGDQPVKAAKKPVVVRRPPPKIRRLPPVVRRHLPPLVRRPSPVRRRSPPPARRRFPPPARRRLPPQADQPLRGQPPVPGGGGTPAPPVVGGTPAPPVVGGAPGAGGGLASNPLLPPPEAGPCPANGQTVRVKNYPSSPFFITPFTQPYEQPPLLQPSFSYQDKNDNSRWVDVFEIEERGFAKRLDLSLPRDTEFLGYNGMSPGPTVETQRGRRTLFRFKNNITGYFIDVQKPGATRGALGYHNPCADGSRSSTVHFHGHPSLSPFDGYAEDEFCFGDYKEYFLPSSESATYWFHDHSVDVTAENVYYGLAANHIVHASGPDCDEPFHLNKIPAMQMMLQDKLLDSNAQLLMDRGKNGPHEDSFFGDINVINGVPFPNIPVNPQQILFRFIGAANSRPWQIQIKDSAGIFVHQDICTVVAMDIGTRGKPVPMQLKGLSVMVAERYSVVCDFSKYAGQTLYLINGMPDFFKSMTPYFCNSHLLGRFQVSSNAGPFPRVDFGFDPRTSPPRAFTQLDLSQSIDQINAGTETRRFKFERTNGRWAINGEMWFMPNNSYHIASEGADVGVNTREVWRIDGGGGWMHPIHIHLIKFFVLRRDGNPAEDYELDPTLRAGKDVVFKRPGDTIHISAIFGAHKGIYMFHCHNTIHEDNQMLRTFQTIATRLGRMPETARPNADALDSPNDPRLVFPDSVPPRPIAQAPVLNGQYVQEVLDKGYYKVFYPPLNDLVLNDPTKNPWLAPREGDCAASNF